MSSYPWVIDELSVVHLNWCGLAQGAVAPYGSSVKMSGEMVEHLQRPDIANKHSAPSPLKPCSGCVIGGSFQYAEESVDD